MDHSGMGMMRGNARFMVDSGQGPSYRLINQEGGVKRAMAGSSAFTPVSGMRSPAPAHRITSSSSRLAPLSVVGATASTGSSSRRAFSDPFDGAIFSRGQKVFEKSKGLRHFSTKVCEKVKEKGRTNYNEVADELVQEYFDAVALPVDSQEKQSYDMKNIRRRVYDALNVLMAMNIIEKEKKEIRWVGLPTSSLQECRRLDEEKLKRADRIKEKTEHLYDLLMQLVSYKTLVERNRERERAEGRPADNTVLYLPYVVVTTDKRTHVDCNISQDKSEYVFLFDRAFEIQDDIEVLKRLGFTQGMDRGDVSDEMRPKIKQCLPIALQQFVDPLIDNVFAARSREAQQYQRQYEKKPPMLNQPVPSVSGPRPIVRPLSVARSTPIPVPRYVRASQQPVQARFGSVVRAPTMQQDRYTYQGGSNGAGPKYIMRPMYPQQSVQDGYMDEVFEEEEMLDNVY